MNMKKGICIALACFLLFGMVGCGEMDTDESSVALSSDAETTENSSSADSSEILAENTSETSEESDEMSEITSAESEIGDRSDSILYHPNVSLPSYTVTIVYTDTDKQVAEQLVVTEQESGQEIQRMTLPENQRFTKEPAYAADVTFDGYADLLIPNQQPAYGSWFHAYVWDVETGKLIDAPGFSELSNVALDTDRKQILSHRLASRSTSYSISVFDPDKKEFVTQHSLYWDWSDDGVTYFKEFNEKNEIVTEFSFCGTTLDPETTDAKPYFEDGSVWELASSKWETLLMKDAEKNVEY